MTPTTQGADEERAGEPPHASTPEQATAPDVATPPSAPAGWAPELGARDIAAAIGRPAPTPEQVAVIEADPVSLLVVAGAGSGKTDTMASRVVWLVANGLLHPRDVLGLTFTRKAAAELAERITGRLALLAQVGLWHDDGDVTPPTISTYHAYAGRIVSEHGLRLGVEPDARLLTEAAAWQIAHEAVLRHDGPMDGLGAAESTVTAAVTGLASELAEHLREPDEVIRFAQSLIERIDSLPPGATRARGLPREVKALRTHLRDQLAILPIVEDYRRLKAHRDSIDFADQMALAARLAERSPQVRAGERARFRAVLLDEFQDTSEAQLRLLYALFGDPTGAEVGAGTSVLAPVPVMAVGDPHQSIYGWRGASATTLSAFARRFAPDPRPSGTATPGERRVPVLPLTTSWRNDSGVLAVANAVARPLGAESAVPVHRLVAAPGAGQGFVRAARHPTSKDEASAVAQRVAAHWWADDTRDTHTGVSAAVLCRRRAQFPDIVEALRAQGLPVEVVGRGGLLSTPEVVDLVALLGVVHDPARGDLLMRLLTGPRVRLGAADLAGLGVWARELMARRAGTAATGRSVGAAAPPRAGGSSDAASPGVGSGDPEATIGEHVPGRTVDAEAPATPMTPETPTRTAELHDVASLVEAIDALPSPGWTGPAGETLSAVARRRCAELADVVGELRTLTGASLPEIVVHAERALGLDVEVAARPDVPETAARVHLDAFADAAASFAAGADRPTLGGFLTWLDAAREQERGLDLPVVQANEHAVQVLTVHAAKGLEWDVVAVPGLVEGAFPSFRAGSSSVREGVWRVGPAKDRGWTGGLDPLPYELRGDVAGLPALQWRSVPDLATFEAEIVAFHGACGHHQLLEERRLAYVALTRARHALYLSASVWTDAATPRVTSRFLTDLLDVPGLVDVDEWAPMPPTDEPALNPLTAHPPHAVWPPERHHARRDAVAAAAALVRDEQQHTVAADSRAPGGESGAGPGVRPVTEHVEGADDAPSAQAVADMADLDAEIDALLAERARTAAPDIVELPGHLSASAVVALARDPAGFVRRLRRPMPEPPATQARRGSAFHAWIEEFYGRAALFDIDPEVDDANESFGIDVVEHLDDADESEGLAGRAAGVGAVRAVGDAGDEDGDAPRVAGPPPGAHVSLGDPHPNEVDDLAAGKELFLASEWAARTPLEIEVNVETVVSGMPIRGRLDAVFDRGDGGVVVVDWKTGRTPHASRLADMAIQLAVYRLAYRRLHGLRADQVDAAFYFAGSGETVYPDLPDDDALVQRLAALLGTTDR